MNSIRNKLNDLRSFAITNDASVYNYVIDLKIFINLIKPLDEKLYIQLCLPIRDEIITHHIYSI